MKNHSLGRCIEGSHPEPFVEIIDPRGRRLRWPTFEFQPHRRERGEPDAIEAMIPTGPVERRFRFTPMEPGRYEIAGTRWEVPPATVPGYLRLDPNRSFFQWENGEGFFPIGANFCWPNMNGVFPGQKLDDLFDMLRRLREAGGNSYRLWANAAWTGLTLDWADPGGPPVRFGEWNQAGAARLDAIMEESERLGLAVMFCMDCMNVWAGGNIQASSYWHENGGPCHSTRDYFDLPEARAMTREKMRYVAARWGYSPAIWCWELWNEIDGCGLSNVTPHSMLAWHQEMAQALRAADPVRHPITTSMGHPLDFPQVWRLPEIEFTQTHHYGYKDSVDDIVPFLRGYHETAMKLWGKPHFFGELGITWCGPGYDGGKETDGRTLHNVLWSTALLHGSCGAGYYWSWDGYIHKHDLYSRFTGIAKFLAGENWSEQATAVQPVSLRRGETPGADELIRRSNPPETLKLATCLSATDYYQSIFTIGRDGSVAEGGHLIPNLFHGKDQPLYRFRITLRVDYPSEGDFTIKVWGGGANLSGGGQVVADSPPVAEVRIDGQVALARPVQTEKPKDVKTDYCDALTVRVPAGAHEISIENVGGGVFHTGHYLLEGYRESRVRADAQALRVGDAVYLWVRNTEFNWATPDPAGIAGAVADLPGWPPHAAVRVEWWDTVPGTILRTETVSVDAEGRLSLRVPDFHSDIAAKIKLDPQ